MNISGFPLLISASVDHCAQTQVDIVNTQLITTFGIGDNSLDSADVDAGLVACDGNGQINGTFDSVGQNPLAPPSAATGQPAIISLVLKGWTVTTDPWEYIFDDGTSTFWMLVVNDLGNVGTTSSAGPATADVVLDDGAGGFWKVVVDVSGDRGTVPDAGPATAAPVIEDSAGVFWQLVVDPLGNLGATSL